MPPGGGRQAPPIGAALRFVRGAAEDFSRGTAKVTPQTGPAEEDACCSSKKLHRSPSATYGASSLLDFVEKLAK